MGNDFVINNDACSVDGGKSTFFVLENASFSIGNNSGFSSSVIYCSKSIEIGDNVNIGFGCVIIDTDFHSMNPNDRASRSLDISNAQKAPIKIGNNVFIGARSIILKGVRIGNNSTIAAGSVVSKSIPDNEVWGGNPCRMIRRIGN